MPLNLCPAVIVEEAKASTRALATTDIGKTVSIKGNTVIVDGEVRRGHWSGCDPPGQTVGTGTSCSREGGVVCDCSGEIKDIKTGGGTSTVTLENGQTFRNPDARTRYYRSCGSQWTFIDKRETTNLLNPPMASLVRVFGRGLCSCSSWACQCQRAGRVRDCLCVRSYWQVSGRGQRCTGRVCPS